MARDQTRSDRILERRAARTRRSKWLGRLLFSLMGMGLLTALRMNPEIIEDVVAMAHDVPPRVESSSFDKPIDVHVRQMPRDVVPVRRGGTLPDTAAPTDMRQQEASANALQGSASGG